MPVLEDLVVRRARHVGVSFMVATPDLVGVRLVTRDQRIGGVWEATAADGSALELACLPPVLGWRREATPQLHLTVRRARTDRIHRDLARWTFDLTRNVEPVEAPVTVARRISHDDRFAVFAANGRRRCEVVGELHRSGRLEAVGDDSAERLPSSVEPLAAMWRLGEEVLQVFALERWPNGFGLWAVDGGGDGLTQRMARRVRAPAASLESVAEAVDQLGRRHVVWSAHGSSGFQELRFVPALAPDATTLVLSGGEPHDPVIEMRLDLPAA